MKIIKKITGFTAILLAVCVVISLSSIDTASANMPSRRMIRAGLNWNSTAVPSADLANNPGSGFEWGTFNTTNDNFTHHGTTEAGRVVVSVGNASNEITIRRVDTNEVLATFTQNGTAELFGVRPLGENPSTRYRSNARFNNANYTFFGGFRFERRGNLLTVVNVVDLEYYVKGVVPYEMGPLWHIEALRAQAIAARSFGAFRMVNPKAAARDNRFDVCIEACCQVYWGRRSANTNTNQAIISTHGMVVTHNGRLAETLYSSSHGGASENNENVWTGGAPRPYLRGVIDNFEQDVAHQITLYNWNLSVSQTLLTQRVQTARSGAGTITWIRAEFTPTGNVHSVIVYDSNSREFTFRGRAQLQSLFGVQTTANTTNGMRSQRFTINGADANELGWVAVPPGGNITISGTGWGHNVGLSQWGALSMAREHGRTGEQIIHHYFTGVEIIRLTLSPAPPSSQPPSAPPSAPPQGATGSWQQSGNNRTFLLSSGQNATGWQHIEGERYFFNNSGVMQTGWVRENGLWYYLRSTGVMATGFVVDGGETYYLRSTGTMATGWVETNGHWYFFNGNTGAMVTGWIQCCGEWYFMNHTGAMATGWIQTGGHWYFLNDSGAMATGWVESDGQWYYMRSNGSMATGTITINRERHRFASDGRWLGRA